MTPLEIDKVHAIVEAGIIDNERLGWLVSCIQTITNWVADRNDRPVFNSDSALILSFSLTRLLVKMHFSLMFIYAPCNQEKHVTITLTSYKCNDKATSFYGQIWKACCYLWGAIINHAHLSEHQIVGYWTRSPITMIVDQVPAQQQSSTISDETHVVAQNNRPVRRTWFCAKPVKNPNACCLVHRLAPCFF